MSPYFVVLSLLNGSLLIILLKLLNNIHFVLQIQTFLQQQMFIITIKTYINAGVAV